MKQLITKTKLNFNLKVIYIILSIIISFLFGVELLLKKIGESIEEKYSTVEEKEKEIMQIRESIRDVDLDYKFSSLDTAKLEIFDLVENLSKRIPVVIDGDFQIVDGRVIVLNIKLEKDKINNDDISYLFNTINNTSVYVVIKNLNIEKGQEGGRLSATLELKRFIGRLKLRYSDLVFLLLPVVSSVVLTFLAEFVYNRYVSNYIQNIQIVDTASLDKVKLTSSKVNKEPIKTKLVVDALNIPNTNTAILKPADLPPLEKILPFKDNPHIASQPTKPANLTLQAIYVSSTQKFAVIDGKIYKEGSAAQSFKVLVIDVNKVQIETDARERIWLKLQ